MPVVVRTLWIRIVGVLLGAVALVVFGAAAPAHADPVTPGSGLQMTIRTDDPLAPTVTLVNRTGHACRIAPDALGTVAVTSMTQGGTAITPIATAPTFPEGLDLVLASELTTLPPGGQSTFHLTTVPVGPTGHMVETASWSLPASYGQVYPVRAQGDLRITASYSVPVAAPAGTPLCPATATTLSASAAQNHSHAWVRWAIVAAVVALLIAVLAAFLLLRARRRRKPGAAVVAAILVLGAFTAVLAPARPALAIFTVAPPLQSAFTGCTVAYAHNDPAGILPWLTTSPLLIPIVEGDTHESTSSKGHPFVAWNPNDPSSYGDGSEKEKCEALYHELFHAYQDARGGTDFYTCFTAANGNTHIPVADVLATRWQNQFRVGEGLKPRPTYDGAPMPDGPCLKFVQTPKGICATPVPDKEPEPPSLGLGCGDDNGDPHLTTFDGLRYDFQAAGEFVLAHDGDFQVQVRSEPYPGSPVVAVNTAAALDMAGDRVEVDLVAGAMQLVVNGRDTALGAVTLPHGGTIAYTAPVRPTLDLTWPDGSRAEIAAISVYGLHVTVQPSPTHSGHLSGLLGDFNGATANDLVARGKTLPAQPSYDALYPGFADAWRITDATSLFTYPPGTNTATYTDRSFPRRPPATMASEAGASALCQRIGVTDPHALADCTLDVAETGQAAFADAALDSQTLLGASATPVPAPSGTGPSTSSSLGSGREATLSVTARNGNDRLTFPAAAGTRVLVDILSSTVPTGCGEIHLFKPSGNEIGTGCIDGNHTGIMGGYLLDTAGTYALTLTPAGGATGSVHVRLTFSTDIHAALTPNGPMQTATIGTRGQVADYTFQGTAGQRVYVEADNSTFPHECGLPALIAPDGVKLTFGCALGNVGSIDGTLLPATGQYSVVLDPGQGGTGSVDLRLIVSQDVHTAITLGGPPVTIALTQPGQVGQASFTGTKGEKVTVAVSAATVGSECGVLRLVAPNGGALTLGCVGSDGTGSIASTTLPSPGTYVILVDPIERVTGSVTMTLKTG